MKTMRKNQINVLEIKLKPIIYKLVYMIALNRAIINKERIRNFSMLKYHKIAISGIFPASLLIISENMTRITSYY